jgi:hypothetical protein
MSGFMEINLEPYLFLVLFPYLTAVPENFLRFEIVDEEWTPKAYIFFNLQTMLDECCNMVVFCNLFHGKSIGEKCNESMDLH